MYVAFDLDGTLVDPKEGIVSCIEYALDRLDVEGPDAAELARHIGPPLHDTFRKLLGDGDANRVAQAVTYYRERFAVSGIYENNVYPGIQEALDALRASGHTLFVMTSKPTNYARKILANCEMAGRFKQIYGSEMDGRRSDKRELLLHLMNMEHIAPSKLTVVGDRKHDVEAAKRQGARSVGVLWGYGSFEELDAAGADLFCRTPSDLPALLGPREA